MKNSKILLLLILLLLSITKISAQPQDRPLKKLKNVLVLVSNQFKVNFNYNEALVVNKRVKPPSLSLSLNQIISNLENQTKLSFVKLDQSTFVIKEYKPQNFNQINYLDEVVLNNYLTKGISKQNDASILIKPKKLGVLPGLVSQDAFQAIQYLPGITSLKQNLNNINVRGGTHDQNAFYWQGVRLYQTSHFFGMISSVNPLLANKIKIYKTASPANYNEGMSSVIDLQHNFSKSKKQVFYSSINLLDASASYQFEPTKHSQLMFAGRLSLTDLLNSPTYNEYSNKLFQSTDLNLLQQQNQLNLNIDQKLKYYDFAFNYELTKDDFKFHLDGLIITNTLTYEETSIDIETKANAITQSNALVNFQIDYNISNQHQVQTLANLSYYDLSAENRLTQTAQQLNQTNSILDYNLNVKDNLKFDNLTITNAYNYRNVGVRNDNRSVTPDVIQLNKEVLSSHAIINELYYDNSKFKFRLGNRLKLYDKFNKVVFEPRVHFRYKLNSKINATINAEQKYQALYQIINLQQDFLGLENKRWVLASNETQDLLQNLQIELDLNYTKNNFSTSLTPFYKKVKQINSKSQGFQNQLEFLQVYGSYQAYGFESLWQYNLQKSRFWLSYTFQSNNYSFKSFSPNNFPNNYETTNQINFGNSIALNHFEMALGGTFFMGKPYTLINEDFSINDNEAINFLSPNAVNLDSFLQVNFTATYTLNTKKTNYTVGLALLNILDTENTIDRYFELNNTQNDVIQFNSRSIGFTPNLFLNIKL